MMTSRNKLPIIMIKLKFETENTKNGKKEMMIAWTKNETKRVE
jgi:hypothetical protein